MLTHSCHSPVLVLLLLLSQDGVALEAFHYQGGEEDGGFDDADDPSYDNITTATSSSASSLGAAGGLGIDAVSPQPGRRIFRLPSVTSRDANALMTTNNREVEVHTFMTAILCAGYRLIYI